MQNKTTLGDVKSNFKCINLVHSSLMSLKSVIYNDRLQAFYVKFALLFWVRSIHENNE